MPRSSLKASVVICTYNGAKTVERAVTSVRRQTFPAEQYEIIVVNDGSSDNTLEVLKRLGVHVVNHEQNQGLAAARNTGLKAAKGKYYIGFDDDCEADENWLAALMAAYDHVPDALGMSGIITEPNHLKGLADEYMAALGSGNPPSIKNNSNQPALLRFWAYYISHLSRPELPATPVPVRQINGALATFPAKLLREMHGWDQTMSGVEDTDLCRRIHERYPNGNFYATSSAVIVHDPKLTVKALLKRQISRAGINLRYYRRNGLVPPIFPFPILWVIITFFAALFHPLAGVLSLLFTPWLLYTWWPIRAVLEAKPVYMLLSYLQLAEESASMIGMMLSARRIRREQP